MSTNELMYQAMLAVDPRNGIFTRDYRIDSALQIVTGYHPDALLDNKRDMELVEPRQIGMYFYINAGYSLALAGMRFNRDHATALHAKRKIEKLYRRKGEDRLTGLVNAMSRKTEIKPDMIKFDKPTQEDFWYKPKYKFDIDHVISRYRKLGSAIKVSKEFGCSPDTIERLLKKHFGNYKVLKTNQYQ